jgi:hypothetical protein
MAILAATPDMQLADGKRRRKQTTSTVTREQVARLERELATLQVQIKAVEETYGLDNIHLTVARAYLVRLLGLTPGWCAGSRSRRPAYLDRVSEHRGD